jgi:hypothetical protein
LGLAYKIKITTTLNGVLPNLLGMETSPQDGILLDYGEGSSTHLKVTMD